MNSPASPKNYRFYIELSREKILSYYSGKVNVVRVRSDSGEIVQFPASAMRDFMTENGIKGYFEVTVTEENRLVNFKKIG